MNILTQNGKMKKSSQNGIDVYNFGIPAFQSETGFKTCPNAKQCATGCYARNGSYRYPNTINAYEERLKLTQHSDFVDIMVAEIKAKYLKAKAKGNKCVIRIHDSGDFYSKDYAMKWCFIIEQCKDVQFYAYTKMIQLWEVLQDENWHFNNFRLIYSYGGNQDSQIEPLRHYHSKVFQNETDLLAAGYSNASQDDMVAALGENKKIGLIYHGVKKFDNTAWSKVS